MTHEICTSFSNEIVQMIMQQDSFEENDPVTGPDPDSVFFRKSRSSVLEPHGSGSQLYCTLHLAQYAERPQANCKLYNRPTSW